MGRRVYNRANDMLQQRCSMLQQSLHDGTKGVPASIAEAVKQ